MNRPTLALEVTLDAAVLDPLVLGGTRERRSPWIIVGLLFKRHCEVYNRHRMLGVVVDLKVRSQSWTRMRGYRLVDPHLNPVLLVARRRRNRPLDDLQRIVVAGADAVHCSRAMVKHVCQRLRARTTSKPALVVSPETPALQDTVSVELVEPTTNREAVVALPEPAGPREEGASSTTKGASSFP